MNSTAPVDILLLGSGWTGTFLIPHLDKHHPSISYAHTTRDGRDSSIAWTWDEQGGADQYEALPAAKTVVVVFPIKTVGGSTALVEGYESVHGKGVRWIQLGSSGIWDGGPTFGPGSDEKKSFKWTTKDSPFDGTNARAMAEEELLNLTPNSFVLNLSGLWGGTRDPFNWIPRVASTKAALATKASVHLIHGLDVARSIIAVHLSPALSLGATGRGKRYLLTDLRVYCWWDIISSWSLSFPDSNPEVALAGDQAKWVMELMEEQDVRALPRTPEQLGRALDSRDFWNDFGLMPVRGRIERGRL